MPNDNKCDKCGGFETRNLECPQCDGTGYGAIVPGRGAEYIHAPVEKLDTSSIPTVRLGKAEYARVMSEITTNMTPQQRKQFIVTKHIGDYIYTFENHGFGNYRIIEKEIIK